MLTHMFDFVMTAYFQDNSLIPFASIFNVFTTLCSKAFAVIVISENMRQTTQMVQHMFCFATNFSINGRAKSKVTKIGNKLNINLCQLHLHNSCYLHNGHTSVLSATPSIHGCHLVKIFPKPKPWKLSQNNHKWRRPPASHWKWQMANDSRARALRNPGQQALCWLYQLPAVGWKCQKTGSLRTRTKHRKTREVGHKPKS